ncbi:MAG: hypothetical protein K2Q22_08595 [Cytophagales bacterium]|nr:hypothetical protein [Cytophagales bacterium]
METFLSIIKKIPGSYYYVLIVFPVLWVINLLFSLVNNYIIKVDYSKTKSKWNGSSGIKELITNEDIPQSKRKWVYWHYVYLRAFESIIFYVPISFAFYVIMWLLFPEIRY